MKLWKKILIGIFVLVAIVIGVAAYGLYKIGDTYTEKIEPEMKRYVQMTKEQQDEYVIIHMEEFMGNFLEPEELQPFQEILKNNPEVRQAAIDWGRSACAILIIDSKDISAGLSPEDNVKYEAEREEYQQRYDKFRKLLKENQVIDSDN